MKQEKKVYRSVQDVIEADITDRDERMAEIEAFLASPYGARADLELLADYILREELTNTHPDKVTRDEYPFFSERQIERRENKQAPESASENYGSDGRNYNLPTAYRNPFRDNVAKARNGNRRRKHAAFKAGESTYKHEYNDPFRGKVVEEREYPFIIKARPIPASARA